MSYRFLQSSPITQLGSVGCLIVVSCVTTLLAASVQATDRWATSPTRISLTPTPSQINTLLQSVPVGVPEGDGYLLGAGDRVKLDVFNVPEFSGEYQVLPNGTINLPLVGAVSVQGKTLRQASDAISAKYVRVLRRPVVTVSLLTARPMTIAIAGEINRPGTYTVSAADAKTATNLIQLAGGITQAANIRQVQVRRSGAANSAVQEVVTLDLMQLIQGGNINQDLRLRDGDSIFVPTAAQIDLEETRTLAAANFTGGTSTPLKIAIVGEVNRPGPYVISPGSSVQAGPGGTLTAGAGQIPTVTRAIQTAGGITSLADIRNIKVRRLTRAGGDQSITIDFWKLLKSGDTRQDLALQDGDTVEIPTAKSLLPKEIAELGVASFAADKILVNVVGEVVRPGAIEIKPNTTLNQAVFAAGGFNNRAKKRAVTLIRLNPDGTATKRDVSIDFAQGIDEAGNPALRNNDIIIVKKSTLAGISDVLSTFVGPIVNGVVNPVSGVNSLIKLFGN